MKIIILTACLAGVAHSKMCAAALNRAAEKRGHTVLATEIQSDSGNSAMVKPDVIAGADGILIATAVAIMGMERFRGKKVLKVPIEKALRKPDQALEKLEKLVSNS
jgi:PTS system fructose-specific IIB component